MYFKQGQGSILCLSFFIRFRFSAKEVVNEPVSAELLRPLSFFLSSKWEKVVRELGLQESDIVASKAERSPRVAAESALMRWYFSTKDIMHTVSVVCAALDRSDFQNAAKTWIAYLRK